MPDIELRDGSRRFLERERGRERERERERERARERAREGVHAAADG
jgi:hypothetical protein